MGTAPVLPPPARKRAQRRPPTAIPSAAEIARLSSEGYRRQARRQRRRNQATGWVFGLFVLAVVAGAAYAGVYTFLNEDDVAPTADQPGGLAGALGGAIDSVEGLARRNPMTGLPLIEVRLAEVSAEQVLPTYVQGVARPLTPADGLQRYAINVDDLTDLAPALTSDWLGVLASLPQGPVADGVLPVPGERELVLGIATDGSRVLRLAVLSDDPPLTIDTTS
ncbi:MAG TPA: hypothetical protein VNQ73_20865 [Ilumatobacter sp.]|nr:hypothetical protein [Ilumatobacter sp.]